MVASGTCASEMSWVRRIVSSICMVLAMPCSLLFAIVPSRPVGTKTSEVGYKYNRIVREKEISMRLTVVTLALIASTAALAVEPGQLAPDFTTTDSQGQTRHLAD